MRGKHQTLVEIRTKGGQGRWDRAAELSGCQLSILLCSHERVSAELTWWLPRRSSGDTERSTACDFGLRLCFFLPGVLVSMVSMPASATISLQTACANPPNNTCFSSTDSAVLPASWSQSGASAT